MCAFDVDKANRFISSLKINIYNTEMVSCTVLYCIAVLYCDLMYRTVLCFTVLYCTVIYSTLLRFTVLYCTVIYCTELYCELL